MSSIAPTIGRKVYFWQSSDDNAKDPKQAFDATIIYVRNPTTIDVLYTNHYGTTSHMQDVQLKDPDPEDTHGGARKSYATWMPFQVGQAASQTKVVYADPRNVIDD